GLSSDRGQMRLATRAGLTTRTVPSNSRSPRGRTVTLATRRRPCRPTSSKARLRVASNGNRTSPWASAYTPIRLSPTLPTETVFMRSSPPQGGGSLGPGRLRSSRGRTRTCDPPVNSRLLYQLSYSGMSGGPNIVSRGRYFNLGWGAAYRDLPRGDAIGGARMLVASVRAGPRRGPAPRRRRTTARGAPAS